MEKIGSVNLQSTDLAHSISFLEEIDGYTGKKFSDLDEIVTLKENASWKDAIYCAASHYSNTPLLNLKLSTRTFHTLRRAGYNTVESLLLANINDLENVRNFGNKALRELIRAAIILIKLYIDENPNWHVNNDINFKKDKSIIENKINHTSLEPDGDFHLLIRKIFSGDENISDTSSFMSDKKMELLRRVNQAIDVIGFDICAQAFHEPEITRNIINAFSIFITQQENYRKLLTLISEIPDSRLNKKLSPFVNLYSSLTHNINGSEIFAGIDFVKQLEENLEYFSQQENQQSINKFIKWMSFDIKSIIQIFFDHIITKERLLEIIILRTSGETLEEISKRYSLTKERIRQIESEVKHKFRKFLRTYPLLQFVSAELNGKEIISSNEIVNVVPHAEIILYLLKKNPDREYMYNKNLDCFYRPGKFDNKYVDEVISSLPTIILETEREKIFQEIQQNINVHEKYINLVFNSQFHQVGKVWHFGRLSKSAIFCFVIEKYFPHGINIYNEGDLNRLRNKIKETFGEKYTKYNNRACWGNIQRACILCDRGKYIHPSYVSISDELIQKIESYFIKSGRTSMAFHELFDEFKDELILKENITNRYLLQGLIKDKFGDRYFYYRDGISTDPNMKISGEIEDYVRKNSPVTKQELMRAFSGITEAMLLQNLSRFPSIILLENGTYIDAEQLNITDDDYKIRSIIKRSTKKYPIAASKLLEILFLSHPNFLQRNEIHSPNTLFSILQFMFSDEFSFSRPIIASLEEGNVTTADFLLILLDDQEEVNIDDIKFLCDEHHINFQNQSLMISALIDSYFQIDANTLLNSKQISISTECLDQIKKLVFEDLGALGFKPLHLIENFIFYPAIGPHWTPYLLRSIIMKYFQSCFNIVSNRSLESDIIVDKKLNIDNYKDLVQFIVRREQRQDPFTNYEDLISWLVEIGLISNKAISIRGEGKQTITQNKLPNFLKDGSLIKLEHNSLIII